jgi:small-conductance mechanosensitive channel
MNMFIVDGSINWLGNPISVWLDASGITCLVFAGLWILRKLLKQRTQAIQYAGIKLIIEVLTRTGVVSLLLIAIACGSQALYLTDKQLHKLSTVIISLVVVRVGLWTATWIRLWLVRDLENSEDPKTRSVVTLVQFFANFFIGAVVLILLLETFGIQVKTLVAGLGIGGIAVALAVQNVLGDLLAAVSIALDKPFIVGDSLQLENGIQGVVELIGIKTTRLRAATGELIIVSNSDLQKSRLRNFGRLESRSAIVQFEVDKATIPESLNQIPQLIVQSASAVPNLKLERAHVTGITATGISVEYYFTVTDRTYKQFLDAQQLLLISIMNELKSKGVQLAAPVMMRSH